ncbi:MAG: hypothetical protein CVV44_15645 [Spirochaetae bacterium HGW-Spirochaetae-1]|jgi:hypothetical protein|nr:MAG: hypothetical protein CVV44_15645 [Spirochaetae bacterium HGW-Spirochaetae-1]
MIEQYDNEKGYCRMLGHYIEFRYCRTVANGLPCRKVLDCWFETIDVRSFMDEHFTSEEQEKIFTPPMDKVSSILELIEKARSRSQNE